MYCIASKTGWLDELYDTEAEAQKRVDELGPAEQWIVWLPQ